MGTTDAALLERLENYYDRAPRASASTEEVGPFTLFLRSDPRGWPYYARPHAGTAPSVDDVRRVLERQRELVVPGQLEWVGELVPGLAAAAREAGMVVHEHPLMVLTRAVPAPPVAGIDVRPVTADDPALAAVHAAVGAGFEESDEVGSGDAPYVRDRVAAGGMRLVGAFDEGGPVGGGSHQPQPEATELTGIAVLCPGRVVAGSARPSPRRWSMTHGRSGSGPCSSLRAATTSPASTPASASSASPPPASPRTAERRRVRSL